MGPLVIDVRPVAGRDLIRLETELPFGIPEKHADRLARQARGRVVYLIAWHGGTPVGHALLKWKGATEEVVASAFRATCPDIEDVYVVEALRSRGVGSKLLAAAEQLARDRGFTQIGLSVAQDNDRAHALYERLGYADAGLAPVEERGEYRDASGRRQTWFETCVYMTKSLVP